MNNIQKICITIAIASVVAYIISLNLGNYSRVNGIFSYFDPGDGWGNNWLSIISALTLVSSAVGYVLFKDD
jgi:hypothetical protein